MTDDRIPRMKALIPCIREADTAYHKHDRPIMTDREYDALYDELLALEKSTGVILSGSPTQTVAGEVLEGLTEVVHTRDVYKRQDPASAIPSW